jgi:hypothetical protein
VWLESSSSLLSILCCNLLISATEQGTREGDLFVWVRVVGLFDSFVLIYLSQALIITHITRFLNCSGCIFYVFIIIWECEHAAFLGLLAWWW